MSLVEIRWRPTQRELRQFGGLLTVLLIGFAFWLRSRGWITINGLGLAAVITASLAIFRPDWLRLVYVTWMCMTFPIGYVISHLLLAGIFFLVTSPIGCVLRWCGHDALARRWNPQSETYWELRDQVKTPRSYFRQF